jgi:FkbM family methyltransferase
MFTYPGSVCRMNQGERMKIRWRLAVVSFYLNRFGALQRAERLFNNIQPGTLMERRLFGLWYICDVSRWPQQAIFLEGERYIPEARLIQRLLKPGMRIVDVGANVGYYMLMFAQKVGRDAHIIAIEPSPENLPELQLNIERNELENVLLIPKAVGRDQRVVGLRAGINSGVVPDGHGEYKVEQDTLDNIVSGHVDMMTIDIEGYEGHALRGAIRLLQQYRPILFIEIHPEQLKSIGSTASEIIKILKEYYSTINLYKSAVHEYGFIHKFAALYLGVGRTEQIRDTDYHIGRCDSGEFRRPFWAICLE